MSDLTVEEAVRRAEVALAEMGWTDCNVAWDSVGYFPEPFLTCDCVMPAAVWWQARKLSGAPCPCWSCWMTNSKLAARDLACIGGNCTAALYDPTTPPRELLVSATGA